jgi:hypothetical protein
MINWSMFWTKAAASEASPNKAGDQRACGHADECQRDELRDLRQRRELGLGYRGQHAAGDIEVVAVEEHAGADQPKDAVVKRRDRQPVEARAGVYCKSHEIPPFKTNRGRRFFGRPRTFS